MKPDLSLPEGMCEWRVTGYHHHERKTLYVFAFDHDNAKRVARTIYGIDDICSCVLIDPPKPE